MLQLLPMLSQELRLEGPALEIGALQTEGQEDYADVRAFFPGALYVGGDMRPGHGVDCVIDAHQLAVRECAVATALLIDTLEHVQSPFVAVEQAARTLKPGGVLVISSVMNFPIHAHPSDYWRFTPAAFDYLLADLSPRIVLTQGDAEFPQNVIGIAMKPATDPEREVRFDEGVQRVLSAWPEDAPAGPLYTWRPSVVALSQRQAERPLLVLESGVTIGQSFVCPMDGLERIDVKMSTFGRSHNCHVLFRLFDIDDGRKEIAAYRLFGPHVLDQGWTLVPIPLQPKSKGRRYLLTLESPDALFGEGVTAMASSKTVYEDGQLTITGEATTGSLGFQAHCRAADWGVSQGARTEAARAAAGGAAGSGQANEMGWEQVRYLTAKLNAELDAFRADQVKAQVGLDMRLEALLDESREAASLARAVKRNPLARIWNRLLG